MASKFTWIPVFKAVAAWLVDYETRQPELVGILKEVGIDAGLDDKDETGNAISLQEIDPFTFFCMFTKYGIEKRKQLFAKLIQVAELNVPPPSDFDGVPTANAMKVWMFPFKANRQDWMIPTLWKLFGQSKAELDSETFARALQVPGTGFAKLTEALFYVDPDRYFPIDGQTRPWLEEAGVPIPKGTLSAYMSALDEVRKRSNKPFAQLSHDAWEKNQDKSFDAQVATDYLRSRFPDTYSGTSHVADPKQTSAIGSTKGRLLNPTVNATPKSRATGRFNPFPEGARAPPASRFAKATWFMARARMGPVIYHVKMPVLRVKTSVYQGIPATLDCQKACSPICGVRENKTCHTSSRRASFHGNPSVTPRLFCTYGHPDRPCRDRCVFDRRDGTAPGGDGFVRASRRHPGAQGMSTPWGSFPKDVVPSGRLAALTGAGNQVGAHIAAHKVYFALALEVNFATRQVEMGMSFLQDRTKLSRPMLGKATSALESAGVLQVDRDGYRNRYTQLLNAPNAFRKVPRFATRQALQMKLSRGISVLAAWKLYPVLLYLRDGQTGDALATHETLQRYSRVRPEHVSAGVSQLVEWGLVRHRPTESNRNGHPSFVYRLAGEFGGMSQNVVPATPVLKPMKVPF